jgi:hypothetical protein
MKVVEMVTSDSPVPQANVRLQAAQTLLDRVGLGKKDKLEVDVQNSQGLFILPAKEMNVIDGEYEDAN